MDLFTKLLASSNIHIYTELLLISLYALNWLAYIYTYIHIYIYTHTHTYIHAYTYILQWSALTMIQCLSRIITQDEPR
jgi:hypothetical protein